MTAAAGDRCSTVTTGTFLLGIPLPADAPKAWSCRTNPPPCGFDNASVPASAAAAMEAVAIVLAATMAAAAAAEHAAAAPGHNPQLV